MSASGVTVREIVANKFDISVEELSQETSFIQDLDANSLDKVELIMLFEDAFQLEIMDAEAEEIITVGDAETFVERALNAKR
ncbi:acyl carrier protein [Thalassobacter stenotrophicus]|uniref:acyl carrier protein n=1 Tax=Thalassobacter stenotrophicus TaxID=266809 RepID=UPI0022A9C057|nr:acyl carrier protein [Thalassobacter stenotrophicus]UYP69702.1 acyl carrier protein [Thalassobacter stenotrophicus]